MKRLRKFVSLLAAVAVCVLLPGVNALTASAEEEGPVTYYVKFVEGNSEWRYQLGSAWNDNAGHRELYYLLQDIRDGDLVVVEGNSALNLNLPVRLSNLTINHAATVAISAKSIDDCYVLRDSAAAINGDVTNAYVYENARCTFNNNVGTLQVLDSSGLHATVTCAGTVDHLIGKDNLQTYYDYYSFAEGKLDIKDGPVKTDAAYYSTTAPAEASQTQATQNETSQAEAVQEQAPQADTTPAETSSNEYDDVPKTGESNLIFWLLGISALCFAGSCYLKKAE